MYKQPWVTLIICCFGAIVGLMPVNTPAQSDRVFNIGLSVWTGYPASVRGFKDALAEGGFIDGKNINYQYAKSGPSKNRQREIAQKFKTEAVDMVYSLTTPGTVIIKEVMAPETPI
ncbi:MAG: hypothetical protein GY792_20955, partial [Gammaproteobacteria bacterium]|nr:hypothetical protein [Gammaproteobacteria bacterium]